MSIYDKSSLVLIPSGTKTGKVFSQKPTNGDGDFTFTRASAATRVNADGNIEKERSNQLLQSNNFNTTWTSVNSGSVTSGQSGYDGTNDAWLLTKVATNFSGIRQNISVSGVHTISFYAKAGTLNYIWAESYLGGGSIYFDLLNGTTSGSGAITSSMTSVGNGWWRCSLVNNSTISIINFYPQQTTSPNSVGGNVLIQDAQIEQSLVARDYIETTTSAVYGGITDNVPRLDYTDSSCPALLLEPLRTNLMVSSEGFSTSDWTDNKTNTNVTANAAVSPEGVQNATEIEFTTTGGAEIYDQFVNVASSMNIGTIFLKNNNVNKVEFELTGGVPEIAAEVTIDLRDGTLSNQEGDYTPTIEDYGNGWWRVAIGDTSNASVATPAYKLKSVGSNIGSFYAYGAQAEAGAYATSYIPTYGSSVTRNVENCQAIDATLIGQTEGTIFWEGQNIGDNDTPYIALYNNSTNRVLIYYSSGNVSAQVRVASVVEFQSASQSVSGRIKMALGYKNGSYAFYVNGVQVTISTNSFSGFVSPQLDKIDLGYFSQDGGRNNQLLVFKTRLSNAELQDLTTL